MAIEKYRRTEYYGFGQLVCDYSPYRLLFEKDIDVSIDRKYFQRFNIGMRKISISRKDYSGEIREIEIPLYVVYENGVWKEYFTGTPVKNLGNVQSVAEKNIVRRVDINAKDPESINASKNVGIREFVIYEDNNSAFRDMDAQTFANAISEYSEDEIRQIVVQFYDLLDKGKKWGAIFEKNLEDMIKEWKQNNLNAASALETKVGAYARTGTTTGSASSSTFKDKKSNEVNNERTKENDAGTMHGIMPILVVAFVVLFILYIIK
jgi:hypothetical protein